MVLTDVRMLLMSSGQWGAGPEAGTEWAGGQPTS